MTGRAINFNLTLHDGKVSGRITVDAGKHSTLVAFKVPRSLISAAPLPFMNNSGAYILAGPDGTGAGAVRAYAGQSTDLLARLQQHSRDQDKSFFTDAWCITTTNDCLDKAEISYLENRLWCIIRDHYGYELHNTREPDDGYLAPSQRANLDDLISRALIMCSLIGLDLTDTPEAPQGPVIERKERKARDVVITPGGGGVSTGGLKGGDDEPPVRDLSFVHQQIAGSDAEITAWMEKTEHGVTVLKGSTVLLNDGPGITRRTVKTRKLLLDAGKLSRVKNTRSPLYMLERSVSFNSHDEAANFLTGTDVPADEALNPVSSLRFHSTAMTASGRAVTARIYASSAARLLSIVMVKGSEIFKTFTDQSTPGVAKLRDDLMANGGLTDRDEFLVLNEDILFSSPSTAAIFYRGFSVNGRMLWKNDEGRTFKDVFS